MSGFVLSTAGEVLRHRYPIAIEAGLKVVHNTTSSNFVRPDEANKAQSMVKDKGSTPSSTRYSRMFPRTIILGRIENFGHKFSTSPTTSYGL